MRETHFSLDILSEAESCVKTGAGGSAPAGGGGGSSDALFAANNVAGGTTAAVLGTWAYLSTLDIALTPAPPLAAVAAVVEALALLVNDLTGGLFGGASHPYIPPPGHFAPVHPIFAVLMGMRGGWLLPKRPPIIRGGKRKRRRTPPKRKRARCTTG